MVVNDDIYFTNDAGIQGAIILERDSRDTAGQNEKCPCAEAE
ncbi:hypothetical protein SAMN06265173_1389 [Thalassovita litoralis]|uniref:Uncharacterized protein n=1 Tax=Thalassovita litoralis TaxID=1010611 RepID=A0A521FNG0_9RHOB|nr:hypothetical protein SAMN06265173_1389 [Thalassovita litoralis]